jgi:hypothetical protein
MSTVPIQNLDAFDVVGVRNDGGIDLVISCHGPLDGSPATLQALEQKIRNYVREVEEARSPTFFERYNCSPDATVMIYVSCSYHIDPAVYGVLESLRPVAGRIGAAIEVRRQMG